MRVKRLGENKGVVGGKERVKFGGEGGKKVRFARRKHNLEKREGSWQGEGKARGRTEGKKTREILFIAHQGHKPKKIT